MAVKDFKPQSGDAAYTMGIVDLLLECVELSYRPGKSIDLSSFICVSSKIRIDSSIQNSHCVRTKLNGQSCCIH